MTKALAFGQNYSSEGGHRPVRSPGARGRVLVTVGVWLGGIRSFDSIHQAVNRIRLAEVLNSVYDNTRPFAKYPVYLSGLNHIELPLG